jgi:hypothetical protein
MKAQKVVVIIGIFLFLVITVKAQEKKDTTVLYRIETIDGNEFSGMIIYQDSTRLKLLTDSYGEITIRLADIKRKETVIQSQIKKGNLWYPNYQDTRYFWAPSGYGLRKGEAYYQNVWILYNQASVAVSNNFSIGGGMVPLFLFAGAPTPIWIVPKFSIPVVRDKFNIGIGALAGVVIAGEDDIENPWFALLYGVGTVGSRDNNLSFGLAYGYAGGSWAKKPIFNLSLMLRASPKSYFLSENYYIAIEDENIGILSLGGRTITRHIGIDYGLFVPFYSDMEVFIAIPWVGITVPLGKGSKSKQQSTGQSLVIPILQKGTLPLMVNSRP